MWDAHIYAWTPQAIEAGKRRRVKSLEQLTQLVKDGSVMNVPANMGEPNAYIAGLKPTHAIINCSVMAQARQGAGRVSPPALSNREKTSVHLLVIPQNLKSAGRKGGAF